MYVYRIERQKYQSATLSGLGAALSKGNRWNSFGTRLVYTSESLALATLEIAVHIDLSEDLPTDRVYVKIEIPEQVLIQEISNENLPNGWNDKPPNILTKQFGDLFVLQNEAAVLKVPSSIIPESYNYMINPLHVESRKIKALEFQPFRFDQRLKVN